MNRGIKILVIEDSDDDYHLLLEHLKKSSLEVISSRRVENANELKEAIDKNVWDIIISDHRMPNFNSFEALKIVQENGLDLPFIIVSGTIGEEEAVEALRNGANDYIMKDKLSRLVPAIERELNECKNRANEKKMVSQLIDSEKKFRTLFEDSINPIWTTSLEGIIIDTNKAAAELLGYYKEELIGSSVHRLYVDTDRRKELMAKMEENGFVKDFLAQWKTKDGRQVDLLFNFTVWKDNDGNIIGYRGMAHDVTLRYRSQKQLDENLEYFAHLIDHIRNPLAILSAYVQVNVEDEKTKDVVIRQVDRIEKLLKELDQGWMDTEETRKFLKKYM